MSLHVFLQQDFLIERTVAHCTSEFVLIVNAHVLIQMGDLQKFLLALRTLKRKAHTVRFHVLLQMQMGLERFVRAQ